MFVASLAKNWLALVHWYIFSQKTDDAILLYLAGNSYI